MQVGWPDVVVRLTSFDNRQYITVLRGYSLVDSTYETAENNEEDAQAQAQVPTPLLLFLDVCCTSGTEALPVVATPDILAARVLCMLVLLSCIQAGEHARICEVCAFRMCARRVQAPRPEKAMERHMTHYGCRTQRCHILASIWCG